MKPTVFLLLSLTLLAACTQKENMPAMESGIELSYMDTSVRAQDSFYDYANGTWLRETEIPADKARIGTFYTLRDKVDAEVRAIIEKSAAAENASKGSPDQKVGDLYASFMNVESLNTLGLKPLQAGFDKIDQIRSYDDLAGYFGYSSRVQVTSPIALGVIEDFKDPTRYVVFILQDGLGLPNRDYYYDDSEKGKGIVSAYNQYLQSMFGRLQHKEPAQAAALIYALEKKLAEHQRNPVDNRQYDKWDNKYELAKLNTLMADFNWSGYVSEAGIAKQPVLSAAQPEYFESLNSVISSTDLATWRDYLKLRLLADSATLLSEDIYAIHFDFYNKTLRGQEEPLPRWQRGVSLVNSNLGELVGQIYVEQYFPPAYKKRMLELVENLVEAYRESIHEIEWMSATTKEKALEKLAGFLPKIGYPDHWKSYETVDISAETLIDNVMSATRWNQDFELAKLDKPSDRTEWGMNPQVVNAYYHPIQNTINFPAAILQPPFFNMAADDAVNYGAIGMVIGHEIGHGFDDQGSKFNAKGKLENWWTDADRTAFETRTAKLVDQYNSYEPLPGVKVNGELTQGENIGDLAGLTIAYKAWKKSLNGKPAAVIDGLTGEQRFFLGTAQVFLGKYRDEVLSEQVKTDPHSPARYRVDGVLRNFDTFYEVYAVKEGDALYLPEEERVRIW